MIDRKALLNDLKQQVKAAETDLSQQVKAVTEVGTRLRAEYDRARKLGRTAATWNSWLDERVTQVAVAWVLGTVFVRFCEDNRLIPEPYLTAPEDDRRDLALARFEDYVSTSDDPTYRGWLETAFEELGAGQAGRLLFDKKHNPLFQIPLSHDGARDLVDFWRARNEEGVLVHDFTDPLEEDGDGTKGWDTRFLGDLYQDLSEAARKTYALLQTPEFVEEFILDRTMTPAVREFGYEGLKMIDPTCGSGHFVLGAFRRLVRLWADGQPGRGVHERVAAALDSVHGVDLNPFAVAVARFRLLVAAMAASGVRTLGEAAGYEWPIHLAVGDSLIKARQLELNLTLDGDEEGEDELASFAYSTEDVLEYPGILQQGQYHVVVGNPPYITVKDKKLNQLYRELYDACSGTYALSVPFAQRFFELAKEGDTQTGLGYGMVGQITANSFMKREFGKKLVEIILLDRVDLVEVIDTSGAFIPGHGTPTVILIGKRRSLSQRASTIRTVRSVQGEPKAPKRAEEGLVWGAIVENLDTPGSSNPWVSVGDLDRDRYFAKQPWILADGGLELNEAIDSHSPGILRNQAKRFGYVGMTAADDVMIRPKHAWPAELSSLLRPTVSGGGVRDWRANTNNLAFYPYSEDRTLLDLETTIANSPALWPYRTELGNRATFSGGTYHSTGRAWWQWHQLPKDEGAHSWAISFARDSSHGHFTLDRGTSLFKQTAPVIKLHADEDEEKHLGLLGVLNSSTACFWLKQVSYPKGGSPESGGGQSDQPWSWIYEFTGTNVAKLPLPTHYPVNLARSLESLSRQLGESSPFAIAESRTPTAASLTDARSKWEKTLAKMISLQEELDWQIYSLYNLGSEDFHTSGDQTDDLVNPPLRLGERAFEIVLARRVAAGQASPQWHRQHGAKPLTDVPSHWPATYRHIVQKRINAIESNRAIRMVEQPDYKRRWATEGWDALQRAALNSWLLEQIEKRDHWFDENDFPTLVTLSRLTDALSRDEDFVSVAKIYEPHKDFHAVVAELMTSEHVPFLAALRYKPSGLKRRADWEHVWDLQRQEDAAPDELARRRIRDTIPEPTKYASADFLRPSFWKARGKLDVPKERFISYGQSNAATPELYGWAGWDHREQAYALDAYIASHEALTSEELTPFLAGLLELQPWLDQWHNEFDATFGSSPAKYFRGDRQMVQGENGLTDDDLRAWRPAAVKRGAKKK
ncbi:BREX-2 system adenine-specific DNA-methyltransferase PglX [Streptomyces sp. SID14515]|uniref:BREX-2 system adenine-specific DNA-methyltransferase PglX n=1 Tax=Streptomyces sp. SID14515 TaxID=2706074 RepID=UPI0013C941C8|nr:BREX-2 system adenine-specific DNA-methyltransferase PglX [Streptomyces sp. SID14515]NEB38312.1 BREX-2 system adenine-specific DNA-methyltransferase PglX [Streptomyces sp. SID14515]